MNWPTHLTAAADLIGSTPDELHHLDLGQTLATLAANDMYPDEAHALLVERRRQNELLAAPVVVEYADQSYADRGTVEIRQTEAIHGAVIGQLKWSVDLLDGNPPTVFATVDTPDGDLHVRSITHVRDTLAALHDIYDAWDAMTPRDSDDLLGFDTPEQTTTTPTSLADHARKQGCSA